MAPEPENQVKVDPQILRSMVLHVESEADSLRSVRPNPGIDAAGAAVANSAVAQVCEGGDQRVLTALAVVVSRLDHIAAAARGTADSFDVSEESFANALTAMGEL